MGVSVTVGVSVMLRLLLLLLGGNIQWQLVCRRLGCVDFCELCVVVTVVALTAAGFWVWRRSNRVTVLHRNNLTWRTFFFFVAIFTFTERLEVQPLRI